MIFIISLVFIFLHTFTNIHSKLITYTLYQTNDICQHNWKGSICLPIFPLNKTNQPLSIELDINNVDQCPLKILVYIRSRQCIYCPRNLHHKNCNHQRIRRMISTKKEYIQRNQTALIGISLLSILIIGSLFTLLFIKRSQAHTNLLELFNQQDNSNSNIQSVNHIKLHANIKSAQMNPPQPIRLHIPNKVKTTK
ncbi:unnamed protein product [Rotaria socialis]|nr:unnamed protein product [Rotaria socialis]CAF4391092.1 unnamed protein product [Rotaria socialis]CAF4403024.1 unnamed protein product [Rotaria socialis]CAF4438062.1 unnamed protein product [Rotaria socialis]CAF4684921.1 unnamed protein product [Rotaria socialis]